MLTNRTPEAHAWAVKQFRGFRSEGQFVPLGTDRPTVVFPGFDGGAEWGGPAVDPANDILYVNASEMAATGRLALESKLGTPASGFTRASARCATGAIARVRRPTFPSLVGVLSRLTGGAGYEQCEEWKRENAVVPEYRRRRSWMR